MYGTPRADMPADPRNRAAAFGSERLYRPDVSRPYALMEQNLHSANKPSEANVWNQITTFNVVQAPIQQMQFPTGRLLSQYTFLPTGAGAQATFGNT